MLRTAVPYSLLFIPFCAFANDDKTYDRIVVTSKVPAYQKTLSQVLPMQQVMDETSFSADSLATLFSQIPSVNLNGQGGLFQTVNIRGFARWRIQTLVEGVPIYTERRAGTSVEFIPPSFVGQAYLTAGAASTQLGSGAIGGGLDLQLQTPQDNKASVSYGDNQDYRELHLQGLSNSVQPQNGIIWQVSHRHANNSKDGNGNIITDKFEQQALTLRKQSNDGVVRESLLVVSTANNVAKASADDPEDRFTLYPSNDHLLAKVTFDWHNAFVYAHDAKLDTLVTRPGKRVNTTRNESLDFGFQLTNDFDLNTWQFHWRAGVDARSGVKAFETERTAEGEQTLAELTLDADQWEASVAMDFNTQWNTGTWAGGARLAHQSQHDALGQRTQKDSNLSAFIGYSHLLSADWKLAGYISSAYRVPSLTERYFNGSTPRGTVLGDPNLKTETAGNIELSLSYDKNDVSASLSVFAQDIDAYIERLTINDELRQYRNLDNAKIRGVNYQLQWQIDWRQLHWKLGVGGQWLTGEDRLGAPIADITPPQHRFSVSGFGNNSQGFVAVTHRQSSDEVVAGELPTDAVTTLDMGFSYEFDSAISMSINLTNLTDRVYVTSRDDLAPIARGRDIQVRLSYPF